MRSSSLAVVLLALGSVGAKPAEAHARTPKQPADAPPEVLFTFDDGPNPEHTPKVLAALARHHVHAVFFVNGARFQANSPHAERARQVLRDMAAQGHAIGNHTLHHAHLCSGGDRAFVSNEIEGNAKLIEEVVGERPRLFRSPYGSQCKVLLATLARLQLADTGWDVDPQDWRVRDAHRIRDRIIAQLKGLRHGRRIVLMHDVLPSTGAALAQILDWLDHENAARVARGEAPITVVGGEVLLPERPGPLDRLGRILVEQAVGALSWVVAWAGPSTPGELTGLLEALQGREARPRG